MRTFIDIELVLNNLEIKMSMKAIFYNRNKELVRCQFAGMNEKGKPEWLIIEQGKPTVTLAETEREKQRDQHYRLLCLEGEEVDELTLMAILCSFIQGELEGLNTFNDDMYHFVAAMDKHRVEWNKERISLLFRINKDFEHKGKYYLCVSRGFGEGYLGAADAIEDLDRLLEVIEDFCYILEDEFHIDKVFKIVDISSVDENLFNEDRLNRFDRVIKD